MVIDDGSESTALLDASVAETVASSVTEPSSTSAWVTV